MAMNIATNSDGRSERSYIALLDEYFFGSFAETTEVSLREDFFSLFDGFNPLVYVFEVTHSLLFLIIFRLLFLY